MHVRRITLQDDLANIAAQCNADDWGEDSELLTYSEASASLRMYLEDDDNILVGVLDEERLAGVAIGYVLAHPSGSKTLYIDELDTHPSYRRRGVATMMMEEFKAVGRQKQCSEVWLSSSSDNHVAHAFYKKLQPSEQKNATIFGYELK
jgi:ribosomal protein S18 acetylase RimI-like enzyme